MTRRGRKNRRELGPDPHEEERRGRQVLRAYAATNEAEFFAVATEAFFEKPRQLRERHPELYDVLASYYQQSIE